MRGRDKEERKPGVNGGKTATHIYVFSSLPYFWQQVCKQNARPFY